MTQARVARGHSTADRESTGSTVAVPTHEKIVACYLPQIVTIIESERVPAIDDCPLAFYLGLNVLLRGFRAGDTQVVELVAAREFPAVITRSGNQPGNHGVNHPLLLCRYRVVTGYAGSPF